MSTFLTAKWKNLILMTYAVEPELLIPYLPRGLELDEYKERVFVSLVAFEFLDTSVKGIKIPFHVNFPEINLRFYVRQLQADGSYRRGVVFIKELVPKWAIAKVANWVYNEPYQAIPMTVSVEDIEDNKRRITHRLKVRRSWYRLSFLVSKHTYLPSADSTEHFFKEHEWGFGKDRKGNTMCYQVKHPHWEVYELKDRFELKFDFGAVYGERWGFLNGQIPYNVMVAEGSAVSVHQSKK